MFINTRSKPPASTLIRMNIYIYIYYIYPNGGDIRLQRKTCFMFPRREILHRTYIYVERGSILYV